MDIVDVQVGGGQPAAPLLIRQCCKCGLVLNGPDEGQRLPLILGATHTLCEQHHAELLVRIRARRQQRGEEA